MSLGRKQKGGNSFDMGPSFWADLRRGARQHPEASWLLAATFFAGVLIGGGAVAAVAWL